MNTSTEEVLLQLAEQWIAGTQGVYSFSIERDYGLAVTQDGQWLPGVIDSETRSNFCLLILNAIEGK